MGIENLPEPIKKHIENETLREREYHNNRMGVTELLGCLRKTWYRRNIPKEVPLQHAWWFYRGNLLDEAWTTLFERNQVRMTFRSGVRPLVISGRFDFEYENAICDLKTTDTLTYVKKDGPKVEHMWQVLFYCWCEAKMDARLYYVSLKDSLVATIKITDEPVPDDQDEMFTIHITPAKHKEIVDAVEKNAITLYDALVEGVPPRRLLGCLEPPKTVSRDYWMCRYCEYSGECWSGSDNATDTGGKDSARKSKH